MKLIVNLKLQPTPEQARILRQTLELANKACNAISEQAWGTQTFRQYNLHKLVYHSIRDTFDLSAQVVVRLIAKVADAYKLDTKRERIFRLHGSIAYDDRILSCKRDDRVSIWTVEGRQAIPFVCGEYQRKLLPFRKGETDLIYRKGSFYLNAVCDVDEPLLDDAQDVIGVDFGIVNLATDSDGEVFTGAKVDETRRRYAHRRRNLQRKLTRSAKRKLKRLSGKQSRFQRDTNHVISKRLVLKAKDTTRAIAVENLKGIRERVTVRRSQRARHHNWAFAQLRNFLEYKTRLYGVRLYAVDPRHSSRECSRCGYTDKANRQSQDKFLCQSCGHCANADFNAALNLRARAVSISQTSTSVDKAA
ncbi:MAG: IS200/IS605 family element transposase accessory protein TnpB [Pyrinomonadaceae bacterium]|nr:IS200/IS605 family element transposase accessory protein TnpB [Pyrinomonadaceae bacterium]